MKKKIVLLFVVISCVMLYAQEEKVIYEDEYITFEKINDKRITMLCLCNSRKP